MKPNSQSASVDAPVRDLADFINLEAVAEGVFRAHYHQGNRGDRIFGGCLLAQALHAAERTAPDRTPHSMHAHFHRAGSASAPVDYQVEAIRDGGSFSSRRVTAFQFGKMIFEATVSFQIPEAGFEHATAWREAPPPPESVPSLRELGVLWRDRFTDDEWAFLSGFGDGFETRIINAEDFLLRKSAPQGRLWTRPLLNGRAAVPSLYAGVAFVSDWLMPAACNLPHLNSTFDTRLIGLSLDHVVWFHAPLPAESWMYYEVDSPWAGNARGLSFGRIFSPDGRLVASTAQEQLIRMQRDLEKP